MRVLLANSERGFRGGEFQTAALARGLVSRNIEVLVAVARGSLLGRELEGKVPVHSLGYETIPVSTPLTLCRLMRAFHPHVVHAQTSRAHTHLWIAGRLLRSAPPLVVSRRVAFSTAGRFLEKLKYGTGIAHYIPISQAAAASLHSAGVPDEMMTVVPSGVDVDVFRRAIGNDSLRDRWGVKPGTSIVGTVAALEREKGLEVLVEAAAIVMQRRSDCTFIILGEGKGGKKLAALIEEGGLEGRVIMARPAELLEEALPLFDLFVLPSLEEGLSTSLIAALAAGRPVIASRTGGIPEVIDEGNGILVPPNNAAVLADAIDGLLDDPLQREYFSLSGPRRAADFDIERTVESTIAVYRSVIDQCASSTTLASPNR
jgi:glycosyltransferase involved in cell wall biosynthesis